MNQESSTAQTEKGAEQTQPLQPIASQSSFTTPLLFLLVIALGSGAGWLGWQYLQQQKAMEKLQLSDSKNNQLYDLEKKTLTNRLVERDQSLSQTEHQMAEIQKKLQTLTKQQQQEQDPIYSKTYYHLLEADYMTRLAALNLSFGQNIPAAIALLQAADQRIQETENPSLDKIRQALAAGILSLQAVPNVDTAGLLTRLTAIQAQIIKLPLFGLAQPVPTTLPQTETTSTIDATEKRWKRALKETWVTLQKIIIIRQRNQPVAPLIAPDQESYLRQNLHLLLQQAQWGVIHGNAAVYQSSLQQAIDWIQQYFANNEPATQATLSLLASLQKVNLQPALPNISPALQALTDALQGNKPQVLKSPVVQIQQTQGANQP
jgi:uroporphyrin-3 C-methyltransferase